jgi:hypothetical protein
VVLNGGAAEQEAAMNAVSHRQGLVVLALCVAFGGGCGKGLKLVPVSGVVVNGNKPVTRATIAFAAEAPPGVQTLDGYGSTDAEGKFTIQTITQGPGVPAGRYKLVLHSETDSARFIPNSITSLTTTPLVVEVPEDGTQDLKLDLSKYK